MSVYRSGFAEDVTAFVDYRKKSSAWNETVFGQNIRLFDRFCADSYPGEKLTDGPIWPLSWICAAERL